MELSDGNLMKIMLIMKCLFTYFVGFDLFTENVFEDEKPMAYKVKKERLAEE